jgi:uncharacterized protein (TIGR02145 family)
MKPKATIIFLLIILIFTTTCEKPERNNPWDKKAIPESWAPQNLQITNNSIRSITLTWQYNNTGEDGYKIERKYEGENWAQLASVTSNNYEDNNFNLNTQVYYRVCAYAGNYSSSWAENDFDATLPPPENLQITINSATSITLTWNYNHAGHEGFKIDRKINEGIWEEEFATLNAGQANFSDDAVDLQYNTYSYRVYGFYQSYQSNYTEQVMDFVCGYTLLIDNRDGNEYETVQIGDQCWMKENLAYLPSVSDPVNGSETSSYYYVYGYEGASVSEAKATANYQTYGVLYNWPAALTACPQGWHLPSDDEWTILTDYLGGGSVAGGKMKEAGTVRWDSPNTDATNSSSFSALPGGYRDDNGRTYNSIGGTGVWWSSSEYSTTNAWIRLMGCNFAFVYHDYSIKACGFSVRCLRD